MPTKQPLRREPNPSVYQGWLDYEDDRLRVVVNGRELRHVQYHSLALAWGYGGSGPADLALSILARHFGETWVNEQYLHRLKLMQNAPKCWQLHQNFKRACVATWPSDGRWTMTTEQITEWVTHQHASAARQDGREGP